MIAFPVRGPQSNTTRLRSASASRGMALPLLAVSLVAWWLPAAPALAAAKYAVQVQVDREDAIYDLGDAVTFTVTVTRDGKPADDGVVSFQIDAEAPPVLQSGEVRLSQGTATLRGSLDRPGFLRCIVSFTPPGGNAVRRIAGAAIAPLEIEPSLPVPADFDEFWAEKKAELAAIPPAPRVTRLEPTGEIDVFDVQVACVGWQPVSGYLGRPRMAKPGSLPAILWVHGAGVRSSSRGNAVQGARHGMLSMDINAHGLPNGKPAKYYSDLRAGTLAGYPAYGRERRESSYFVNMYLRLVRAIDFLTAQPEWDGRTVIVIGHSQGGGQALVAGGIDPRVTCIAAGVPAICDHTGGAIGRVAGWPKLVPAGADGQPDPRVLEASRYVDAVNFASRCQADAIMSIGFIDTVCPPTTDYAAYNQLQGDKQVLNEIGMGHAAPQHVRDAFMEFIQKHVKQQAAQQ